MVLFDLIYKGLAEKNELIFPVYLVNPVLFLHNPDFSTIKKVRLNLIIKIIYKITEMIEDEIILFSGSE